MTIDSRYPCGIVLETSSDGLGMGRAYAVVKTTLGRSKVVAKRIRSNPMSVSILFSTIDGPTAEFEAMLARSALNFRANLI